VRMMTILLSPGTVKFGRSQSYGLLVRSKTAAGPKKGWTGIGVVAGIRYKLGGQVVIIFGFLALGG